MRTILYVLISYCVVCVSQGYENDSSNRSSSGTSDLNVVDDVEDTDAEDTVKYGLPKLQAGR